MRNKIKRYITLVLSLAMIVSLFPTTFAQAEEIETKKTTKGQVSFNSSSGGTIKVWDDNGNEYSVSEDNNDLLLEYETGTVIHTEVKNNEGYEAATYKIITDNGTENDLLTSKEQDIVITEGRQEVVATFNKVKTTETTPKKETVNTKVQSKENKAESTEKEDNSTSNIQAGSVITKSTTPMRAASNGISAQVDDATGGTTDPVITVNIHNQNGSVWKTFSYTVPYST